MTHSPNSRFEKSFAGNVHAQSKDGNVVCARAQQGRECSCALKRW